MEFLKKTTGHTVVLEEPPSFEISRAGAVAADLPALDVPRANPAQIYSRTRARKARLPELSEPEVIRHFTRMSTWNYAIDLGIYPLGSCTMKYNPKINEDMSNLPRFSRIHPLQS